VLEQKIFGTNAPPTGKPFLQMHILSMGKRSNKICMTMSTIRKIMSYKDIGRKIRLVSNNIIHSGEL